MASEENRCIPCEQHAELHKGDWLGLGSKEPCLQCEQHAVMHSGGSGAAAIVAAALGATVI